VLKPLGFIWLVVFFVVLVGFNNLIVLFMPAFEAQDALGASLGALEVISEAI